MKCRNCREAEAVKRNVYCPDCLREMSKRFDERGLSLTNVPTQQYQPQPAVNRKRGVDYRGSVK